MYIRIIVHRIEGILRLHHVGIAVQEAAPVLAVLREVLGLLPGTQEDIPPEGVRIHFMGARTPKLELLEQLGAEDSPVQRFLDRRGEGVHHLAFEVNDLELHMERMREAGFRPIGDKPYAGAGGNNVYFLHPSDTHGVLLEFCQHAAPEQVYVVGDESGMGGSLAFSSRYRPIPLAEGTDLLRTDGYFHLLGIAAGNRRVIDLAARIPNAVRTLTICNPAPNTPSYLGESPVMIVSVCNEPAFAYNLHRATPGSRLYVLPTGGDTISRVIEEHFSAVR